MLVITLYTLGIGLALAGLWLVDRLRRQPVAIVSEPVANNLQIIFIAGDWWGTVFVAPDNLLAESAQLVEVWTAWLPWGSDALFWLIDPVARWLSFTVFQVSFNPPAFAMSIERELPGLYVSFNWVAVIDPASELVKEWQYEYTLFDFHGWRRFVVWLKIEGILLPGRDETPF